LRGSVSAGRDPDNYELGHTAVFAVGLPAGELTFVDVRNRLWPGKMMRVSVFVRSVTLISN